jgi:uncharacterized Zn-binding protein involved in type VI secretion
MEIIGWVRQGDKAACGAMVCEGDPTVISMGLPYTFQGAKLACKKNCVIAEGYLYSILTNGKPQVLHGMMTSGSCPLISTLNDFDGVGNESGEAVATAFFLNADGFWTGAQQPPGEEPFDEQVKLQAPRAEGMPYFVKTMDGRTFSGRVGPTGLLPRIGTYGEDEYEVLWGDEALAQMTDEQVTNG